MKFLLVAEMTGEQKQSVYIESALTEEPEVINCDEITLAFDQIVTKRHV